MIRHTNVGVASVEVASVASHDGKLMDLSGRGDQHIGLGTSNTTGTEVTSKLTAPVCDFRSDGKYLTRVKESFEPIADARIGSKG